MSNDINRLSRVTNLSQVDIRHEDALLVLGHWFHKLSAIGTVDHGKAASGRFAYVWKATKVVGRHIFDYLRGDHCEARAFNRHKLRGPFTAFGGHAEWPFGTLAGAWNFAWHWPDQRPTSHVYVYALRVFVISEKWLEMLPAAQGADAAKRAGDNCLERLGLTFAPDGSLDVCGLDLSPMIDDFTLLIYVRLRRRSSALFQLPQDITNLGYI